ncbi:hypothetical protein FQA47_018270 [Oryzias melastigma]|uniref:Uncharacterized protein n=1 Tax=Oryzias melastigma TaxID=30732 RepID=A0A834L2S8_ORYME|nr:hypothetical protein FQA47_018270 [Oryzias melastigma]
MKPTHNDSTRRGRDPTTSNPLHLSYKWKFLQIFAPLRMQRIILNESKCVNVRNVLETKVGQQTLLQVSLQVTLQVTLRL